MTNSAIRERIESVRDEILEIAKISLSLGDVNSFNSLNEVAVVLTEVTSGHEQHHRRHHLYKTSGDFNSQHAGRRSMGLNHEPPPINTLPQVLPVYATYRGSRHDGELDPSRILENGRGDCLHFRDNWMTPAKAMSFVNRNRQSAWRFWRYTRADGTEGRIQEIKDSLMSIGRSPSPSYPPAHPTSEGIRSAIYAVLSDDSPLHRKVILERVLERGLQVGGQDPLTHISAHLSKDDRFRGIGDGYWSLYPVAPQPVGGQPMRDQVNAVQSATSSNAMREAVVDILSSERPLHRRAIYQRLLDRGIHVGGRSPVNNLGAHMSADPRMKSNGNGYWTLAAETTDSKGQLEPVEEYDDEDVPW